MYEVGAFLGGTNFVGDVGSTNYIYPNKLAGAVLFKYNYNPRIAFRATYSYLPISGDNKNADRTLPLINGLNVSELSFTNTIHEFAVGMEFNFYEYDLSSDDNTWTPYILVELAGFNYKSITAQPTPTSYSVKNKTSIALPIGIGYKSKLTGNLAFAVEAKFRYTFEDDLDFVSNKMPNVNIEGTGNDWYMFTGFSLIYTFGRPACYTNGL